VEKEYCAPDSTPLSVETVPRPSLIPPSQCAEPLRFICYVLLLWLDELLAQNRER
jgi:hypothetical protein